MPKGLLFNTVRKFSLRLILVVPFAVQIFVAVGLVGWFSMRNSQRAVDELARELGQEMTARVEQTVSYHLAQADLSTRINADALVGGLIDLDNPDATIDYLLTQLQQFPSLHGVAIATEMPNYIGLAQTPMGKPLLRLWDADNGRLIDYQLNSQGQIDPVESVASDIDHRQQTWYRQTLDGGQVQWQSAHFTHASDRLVVSVDRPVYDTAGNQLGVAEAKLPLPGISAFLKKLELEKTGQVLIVEPNGQLVASSLEQPLVGVNPSTGKAERMSLQDSDDPLLKALSQALVETDDDLTQIRQPQQLILKINDQRRYIQITPFTDQSDLDWLMMVSVSESEFMATIAQNMQMTLLFCGLALLLTTGLSVVTASWIVRPITKITQAADALSQGHWQHIAAESPIDDLDRLTQAFNRMAHQLHTSFNTLAYNAQHDSLTGLLNRGALRTRLELAIEQRQQQQFALFFLDLDDFKLINDSFGHIVGDQLLIAIATRLRETLATVAEQAAHITFSRFGGDEFVILLEPVTDATQAMQVANTFMQTFAAPFHLKDHEIYSSTSIGIALSTLQGDRPEDYLRNADLALYAAKRTGKASYEIFDTQMHTTAVDRLALETDLRKAIRQEELTVYYQPIVNSKTLQIQGFEALLRWHHRQRGIISPDQFIPIAEQSGLILELGWWVMRQACLQMKTWQQQFPHHDQMVMSVNLSSAQFAQPDFTETVEQILRETDLPPQNVKLEITESLFMNSGDSTNAKFKWLQDHNINLSIDDFGTGYSSLSYLYRFPLHTLKIDRSFIHRLTAYYSSKTIVEAIIVLAHKLGLHLIAEGVETVEELTWLQQQGCDCVQGFLFSCPVTAPVITSLLANGLNCPANPLPPRSLDAEAVLRNIGPGQID